MATSIYLGNPPENIKKWIEENYKPAVPDVPEEPETPIEPENPMLKVPLTFTAEESGAKLRVVSQDGPAITLETSTTGEEGSWTPYEVGTEIVLENVGDKVMFRNSSDTIQVMGIALEEYNCFNINSGKIAASGNIMFLMDKTGKLRDLSDKYYCYYCTFANCTSLTQAPELPATTLCDDCYNYMFYSCKSLTKAPELPATTVSFGSYYGMFEACSSLTQAPAFLFETLLNGYCSGMFFCCKSPFTFSDKTFDEVANLIQNQNLIGDSYWYYYDEDYNEIIIDPVEIICSDKTMLVTFDEENWQWTITEK